MAFLAGHTEGGAWRGTTSSSTTSTQTSPEGREAQWSSAPPPGVTEHLRSPAAGRRASKSGRKPRRELWEVSDSQQKISRTSVCKCSRFCFLVSHSFWDIYNDPSRFSVRKRHREERIASTSQKIHQMKQRLSDSERKREKWLYWRPILLNIGAGAAVAVGLLVCWMYSQWSPLGQPNWLLFCTSTWN